MAMDFHALPRRDLQALCKRNGVRANMTNASMADALRALPTVDGVEEYVKQPAAVPEPVGKAAVAEEEVRREKQGSPLPRGRRVTAKTSEVVKTAQGKGKETEKADAKGEEGAAALVVGQRSLGRRARSARESAVEEVAEKEGSPPPRARREPARPDDGAGKEDLKREANKEDAPTQGAVRRVPSRRARGAPVVATSAAKPQVKSAAAEDDEMQGSPLPRAHRVMSKLPESTRSDDSVKEQEEDMKRFTNDVDAPIQGAGRRGPSRCARPAPVVSKPAATSVVEELRSPLPRGPRVTVNVKSSAATSTEGGEEDANEEVQREASKGSVHALGVGRGRASQRAWPEPIVSAPVDEVPAERDATIPRGRGNAKAPEPVVLNDAEEEYQDELKLEEKEEDASAQGVVRRARSRRARAASVEAPATRRSDTASSSEERNVPVEAVLVRPTRVRKPTVKAGEAAEKKVPRRAMKKATPTNSTLQKEKQQDDPQLVVPALLSEEACHDLENVEETADPQNLDQSEVIDETRQEDKELVPTPLYEEACRDLHKLEAAADPQNLEQREVIDEPRQEDKEVVMNENEILMDGTPTEKPPVTNEILMEEILEENSPAIDEKCTGNSAVEKLQCKDKSPLRDEDEVLVDETPAEKTLVTNEILMEETLAEEPSATGEKCTDNSAVEELECKDKSPVVEEQLDVEHCSSPVPSQEDSPILGLVSTFAEQNVEKDVHEGAHFQDVSGSSEGPLDKRMDEENHNASKEMEMVPVIQSLQAPLTAAEPAAAVGFTSHAEHGSEMESSNSLQETEEATMVDAEEMGDVTNDDADTQSKMVDEAVVLDGSGNISSVVEVITISNLTQVTLMDCKVVIMEKAEELKRGSTQLDEDVKEDDFQTDFTGANEQKLVVDGEKVELVTKKLPQSIVTMDKDVEEDGFHNVHVDEQKFVMEKAQLVTDKLPMSTTTMNEDVKEDCQNVFVHVEEHKKVTTTTDREQEVNMNGNIFVDKVLIIKEMQQSTTAMDKEDVADDQLESDFVTAEKQKDWATADNIDEEEKVVEINEEMPRSIGTMSECVQEGYFEIDVHSDEVKKVATADNVLEVTETEDEDVRKENAFSGDLCRELDIARDYSSYISTALIDDIDESLSEITITEPTTSRNEDLLLRKNNSENNTAEPVCKNSSEMNTDESVHENKSKNSAEPVAMQENKGAKVSKKSADLNQLTLGQLRTKLRKTLERKRAALARVDENVCRSNATNQEQARKLQEY